MSARSWLEQAFSVAMAPENSIDGLKYFQSNTWHRAERCL